MEEGSITILYVEDNPDNRMLIRRVLMSEDYIVEEASSASEALEKLKTLRPHLILMDINMPEMDGYTLTAKIRQLPSMGGIPIIALTANVMKGDREKSLEAGCDGYIQKPIDIDTIISQIQRYLKR
ncbi:MAG: response regulator [Chloroflexi bacterium HGW-Chloroflexi-6]|jgi:two-component system cell cycle response regulator DivK|nr:MAG: response regulator [Chloroflexi bacterium HGW-Chloroflexi-6]